MSLTTPYDAVLLNEQSPTPFKHVIYTFRVVFSIGNRVYRICFGTDVLLIMISPIPGKGGIEK